MAAVTQTERQDKPKAADEPTTLLAFLDYHRDTLRLKTAGLDGLQLARTLAPSSMTLGGMLKHLAFVEHWWFRCVLLDEEYAEPWASVDWKGDQDWDWDSAADDSPEALRELFDRAVADSEEVVRQALQAGGLDRLSVRTSHRNGERFSLRWILVHMIEEYARHNGHADLIRESIDGRVGE